MLMLKNRIFVINSLCTHDIKMYGCKVKIIVSHLDLSQYPDALGWFDKSVK